MHLLEYATGYTENKVFYLRNMLKQDDHNDFFIPMDKEVSRYNKGSY